MSTRNLGYLGAGILLALVAVTIFGVPPVVWLPAMLVVFVVGLIVAARLAQADGTDIAGRILALSESEPRLGPDTSGADDASPDVAIPTDARPVDVELVRPADEKKDSPAVWLHRCGGRRVHRYASADGWTVEQVSTKDPDNPRKRVIGTTLTFAFEGEAMRAADDLARGVAPKITETAARLDPPVMATA